MGVLRVKFILSWWCQKCERVCDQIACNKKKGVLGGFVQQEKRGLGRFRQKRGDEPVRQVLAVLKARKLDLREKRGLAGIGRLPKRPFLILASVPGPLGRTPFFLSAPAKRDFILETYPVLQQTCTKSWTPHSQSSQPIH